MGTTEDSRGQRGRQMGPWTGLALGLVAGLVVAAAVWLLLGGLGVDDVLITLLAFAAAIGAGQLLAAWLRRTGRSD